jgi:hypothetical protein
MDDEQSQAGAAGDKPASGDILGRLEALERQLIALQSVVRTRRLVVVDHDGHDRIVGEVVDGHAELRVQGTDGAGPQGSVVIYSSPGASGLGFAVGVQLWASGNAVAELNAWSDEGRPWRAALHLDSSDQSTRHEEA